MSQKKVKKKRGTCCSDCGKDWGRLSLVSIPDAYKKISKEEEEAFNIKLPGRGERIRHLQDRKVKLCPKCVAKAIAQIEEAKKNGAVKTAPSKEKKDGSN